MMSQHGSPFTRQALHLRDVFGEGDFTLLRPDSLCAPSEEVGVSTPLTLDDFACYRARGPSRAPQTVTPIDQFEDRAMDLLRPYLVCNPAG